MKDKFYITTPIYYANAAPHIGSSYTTIAGDVLARYHRMTGDEVFFLTGTDEHGAKIEKSALDAGKSPKEFTDELAAKFEMAWDGLAVSNDAFIRTTDPKHIKASQNALQRLYDKGIIYKGEYEGHYCVGCEQYKTEKDLVDGKCVDHGTVPQKTKEECYMFKLSAFSKELQERIEKDELLVEPVERKNEILSFYKNGLTDIACSRKNVKWGVPLPWDTDHTAYVWMEAFLNYLTGLGWTGEAEEKLDMWPAQVQLMAKDILRVHATIWPAILLALDMELPKKIFVHGYFLVDGKKMSKSIGNVIAPSDLTQKYGVDATRYLLMGAAVFGRDGDIGWEKFDEKFNADLANGLGNLVARSVAMTVKFRKNEGELVKADSFCEVEKIVSEYHKNLSELHIDTTLHGIWQGLINACDQHITSTEPFRLIGKDNEKAGEILYQCLETIRIIANLIWPFMPETAETIWQRLGLDPSKEMAKDFSDNTKWGGLDTKSVIEKGESLFPRI